MLPQDNFFPLPLTSEVNVRYKQLGNEWENNVIKTKIPYQNHYLLSTLITT